MKNFPVIRFAAIIFAGMSFFCSSPENPFNNPDLVTVELQRLDGDADSISVTAGDPVPFVLLVGFSHLVDSILVDFGDQTETLAIKNGAIGDTVSFDHYYHDAGTKTITVSVFIRTESVPRELGRTVLVRDPEIPPPAITIQSPALTRDSAALVPGTIAVAGKVESGIGLDTVVIYVNGSFVPSLGIRDWLVSIDSLDTAVWNEVLIEASDTTGQRAQKTIYLFRMPNLNQPGKPSIGDVGGTSIEITWLPARFCTGHIIERSVSGAEENFSGIATVFAEHAFIDTGLEGGALYKYRIRGFYSADGGLGIGDTTGPSATDSARTLYLFQRVYGDAGDDFARRIRVTSDSTALVFGSTYSFGIGNADLYLLNILDTGDTAWTSTIGHNQDRQGIGLDLYQNNYMLGWTLSCVGAIALPCPFMQIAITESATDATSTHTYAFPELFWKAKMADLAAAPDGGAYIVGNTRFENNLEQHIVIRTQPGGDTLWARLQGKMEEKLTARAVVSSGSGCFVVGNFSYNVWVGGTTPPDKIFVCRYDDSGDTLWLRTYGGNRYAHAHAAIATADGGCVIAGESAIVGADTGAYILKIGADGTEEWASIAGGRQCDIARGIRQTSDGGYIVTGSSASLSAGDFDVYLLRLDASGNELWSKTYGGVNADHGYDVDIAPDGGYIIAGETESFGAGMKDVYIIKTDARGNTAPSPR